MATGRITYNQSKTLGAKLKLALTQLVEGRKSLGELARQVARYNDANADLATDTGVTSNDVQAFKDILARADAEMSGVLLTNPAQGDLSFIRTLLDSMA